MAYLVGLKVSDGNLDAPNSKLACYDTLAPMTQEFLVLCLFGGKTFLSAKKGKAVFCRLSPMCQFIRGYLPALSGKISFLQLYFCDKSLWYKLCRLWIPRS